MLKFMDMDLYPSMKILPKAIVSMVEVQRLLILPKQQAKEIARQLAIRFVIKLLLRLQVQKNKVSM